MKRLLLATLGSSEIQIDCNKLNESPNLFFDKDLGVIHLEDDKKIQVKVKENFRSDKSTLILNPPRSNSEILYQNYETFEHILTFPIFGKSLVEIIDQKIELDGIILVYTNQPISQKKRSGDSIHFFSIIKDFFIPEQIGNIPIIPIEITDFAVDIDEQYKRRKKDIQEIYKNNPNLEEVIMLPQGGIDQVNTAITLRFIEFFSDKEKVKIKQFQQAEGATQLKEVSFPRKFINGVNRRKAISLNRKFYFQDIKSFNGNNKVIALADVADALVSLNFEDLDNFYENLIKRFKKSPLPEEFIRSINEARNAPKNYNYQSKYMAEKMKVIYLSAKVKLAQKQYSDFLWRVITLLESFLKREISLLQQNPILLYDKTETRELIAVRRKLNKKNSNNNNDSIIASINCLNKKRNDLIHRAEGINKKVIESELKKEGSSIETLIKELDNYFGIIESKPYGWFSDIQKIIQQELNDY